MKRMIRSDINVDFPFGKRRVERRDVRHLYELELQSHCCSNDFSCFVIFLSVLKIIGIYFELYCAIRFSFRLEHSAAEIFSKLWYSYRGIVVLNAQVFRWLKAFSEDQSND
ncbi:hypothetical protein NPIL_417731 [Nephila pilipes]|uniref:Uncharacterized protein n=1 Tax=Nephila pilipes TaxID=299642 RepID=A0A8X6TTL0_NEPPI|nr:hypothetical protein NPIL_417731 [Nephila pilipes]